jgi:signal transduction histidine kinase
MYDDMRAVTEPSRSLVTRIHVAIAMEGAIVRDYTHSRDPLLSPRYRAAENEEKTSTAELEPLIHRLGPAVGREFSEFKALQESWHASVRRHFAPGNEKAGGSPLDGSLYEDLLLSAARLDDALNASAEKRWGEILATSAALHWITLLIAIVGLFAALTVAWLGKSLREFAVAARKQAVELEQTQKSRERLVRGITHDLKNPLHAISGHAELLASGLKGPLNERQVESVQRIRSCAADELSLLNDLLDASRAESGLLSIRLRESSIPALIEEIVEEHRPVAAGAGHSLVASISPHVGSLVTDRNRVKQVISNLLSNAIKYSEPGGPIKLSVAERVRPMHGDERGWVAIEVADTGPGIPDDKVEEIFEEFSRLESGAHMPGSGLGLAIARRIARRLGGDIEVANAGGSVFTLWLPRTPLSKGEAVL